MMTGAVPPPAAIRAPVRHQCAGGFSFVTGVAPHADVPEIPCDPARRLDEVELRATCSEGVLGLMGMTLLQSPNL